MAWNKDSIIRLATVDSTNRYTRDDADNLWNKHGENGFVVITATHQTAGRGQRGNTWSSNAGENLLISILVRPGEALEVKRQFLLSQAVALAMHDAMLHYDIDTRLKWPNDIYVGNRKLAGILLELDYAGRYVEQAIIGIGLNVNQQAFPPMDRVPVSMKMLLGREIAVDDLLNTFLDCFSHYYDQMKLCRESVDAEYRDLLLGFGEKRNFIDANGAFEAVIEGVEPMGHLLLRRTDGSLLRYAFKEVEMVF